MSYGQKIVGGPTYLINVSLSSLVVVNISVPRRSYVFLKIFAGLRKVNPYYFTFTTFTKGRWVGETILEVFSREFRAQPQQEYVRI